MAADDAVAFSHVSMRFPGVLAVDDVSLRIRSGEVFALVGENGAGKSTLMNILYGLNTPTGGEVTIRGRRVDKFSPARAISQGVGMVHQHFMLVPSFSAAQNIVLSREPRKLGLFCDQREARRLTLALSEAYGLPVVPDEKIEDMGVGMQQRVEILKTLHRGADILILDEPTAVLTPGETAELFQVIRRVVKEKGMTVILITHKLYEVMAIAQRVGVMRAGKLVAVKDIGEVDEKLLASLMVGREMLFEPLNRDERLGQPLVTAENLKASDPRGLPALSGVSFMIRGGEILGVAAVEGNGQRELCQALAGLIPLTGGKIEILGRDIAGMTPGQVRALGLSHIPEDRLTSGVSAPAPIWQNLLAGKQRLRAFALGGVHLRKRPIRAYARELFHLFDIRAPGIDTPAGALSGGNMQKVVAAREFSMGAKVLIVAQPTRGIDIGAMESIHHLILDKRNQGCAILLVSADLDEVFRLSDRIVTLFEGRITGEFGAKEFQKERIGYCMTGGRKEENG